MTMRSILVPIESEALSQPQIQAAMTIGSRFRSVVAGLDARAPNAALLAAHPDAVAALPRDALQEGHRGRRVRANFERLAEAGGLSLIEAGRPGPGYRWHQAESFEDADIAGAARLFDLTVLARPDAEGTAPRISLLEAVLFESGRPVLLVPRNGGAAAFEHALVAWNRSSESVRTVALAMPLLEQCRKVTVLSVSKWRFPGPSGEEFAAALRQNGVAAEAAEVPGEWAEAGAIIAAEAARRGCDHILKGAYTQSRLRQLMFGGATRHLIWNAAIPVLMAH
jgi:nucleotide-binding universal stress UspA family protein